MTPEQEAIVAALTDKGTADEAYLFDCLAHDFPEYLPLQFFADLETLLTAETPLITRAEQGGRWITLTEEA